MVTADVAHPVFLNRSCARQGCSRFDRGRSVRCLTHSAARLSPCAITRSPTFTWTMRAIDSLARCCELISSVPGVARVYAGLERSEIGLDHSRAGDLVALSRRDSWFAYPYWLDDRLAPDFARTVDIHRKPGYDPCELFFDPSRVWPQGRAILAACTKELGLPYTFRRGAS